MEQTAEVLPDRAATSSTVAVVLLAALVLVPMLLYPPWVDYRQEQYHDTGDPAYSHPTSYGPLWDPPIRANRIDFGRLALQVLAVAVCAIALKVLIMPQRKG